MRRVDDLHARDQIGVNVCVCVCVCGRHSRAEEWREASARQVVCIHMSGRVHVKRQRTSGGGSACVRDCVRA